MCVWEPTRGRSPLYSFSYLDIELLLDLLKKRFEMARKKEKYHGVYTPHSGGSWVVEGWEFLFYSSAKLIVSFLGVRIQSWNSISTRTSGTYKLHIFFIYSLFIHPTVPGEPAHEGDCRLYLQR